MVNSSEEVMEDVQTESAKLNQRVTRLAAVYVAVVVATDFALVLLSVFRPVLAIREAWGHAVVVSVFAVVLPLRVRAARRGGGRGWIAVAVIALVLCGVNLFEALIPGFFPIWMRIVMLGTAVIMAFVAVLAWRGRPRP